MAEVVKSFAISGVDGYLVDVETKTIAGMPMMSIVGLGDTAVKEAKERVESALNNEEFYFPQKKIVINLAPGDLKKAGSHFDLPIALGILLETKQITKQRKEDFGVIGELSLNGKLRSGTGVLPMAIAAKEQGLTHLIVPAENLREASVVEGLTVYGFKNLKDVTEFFEGKAYEKVESLEPPGWEKPPYDMDFADVQEQEDVIDYVVIAASGGHNLMMIGTPGCGKSMIAKRISSILPTMTEEEAMEVTKIYSVAGLLRNKDQLIRERPFRAPHHNASTNSLIGGGNSAVPGEISLAHNGVLFLDEMAEFSKKTLDALRQPMEDRKVTISRVKYTNTYPSNFMLVAAMNPCACGYFGRENCKCSDYEVVKYRQKISGPIMDRMDIQKTVGAVDIMEFSKESFGRSSKELRKRVEFSRGIQKKRFEKVPGISCNAQMNHSLIKEYCGLDEEGERLIQKAYERFQYSARTFHKYLKVARTFADMEGADRIRREDVAAALMARDLDKEGKSMMVL